MPKKSTQYQLKKIAAVSRSRKRCSKTFFLNQYFKVVRKKGFDMDAWVRRSTIHK